MRPSKSQPRRRRSKQQQEFINSLLFFITSILSIAGLLTYLWVYNEIGITARENDALQRIRGNVGEDNLQLRSEIAGLRRVDRITGIARSELNMVTPEPETLVVFVNPDRVPGAQGQE
ncbi:MAG: hypothetical protein ACE5GH_05080 [Fidelibacterota bacterium]